MVQYGYFRVIRDCVITFGEEELFLIYLISLILSVLLPILHAVLIGMTLKRAKGIAPKLVVISYVAIVFELICILMLFISELPDTGPLVYIFLANIFGIIALPLQIYGYLNLRNLKEKREIYNLYLTWSIVIVMCLIYWPVYYIYLVILDISRV